MTDSDGNKAFHTDTDSLEVGRFFFSHSRQCNTNGTAQRYRYTQRPPACRSDPLSSRPIAEGVT